MEAVLLLIITICLGLSQKEGSNYYEIEVLDRMVNKKYGNTPNKADNRNEQSPNQTIPPIPKQTIPPNALNQPKNQTPVKNTSPISDNATQKVNPLKSKPDTKPSTPSGFSFSDFDFESVMSTTIDENAFKELEKER